MNCVFPIVAYVVIEEGQDWEGGGQGRDRKEDHGAIRITCQMMSFLVYKLKFFKIKQYFEQIKHSA